MPPKTHPSSRLKWEREFHTECLSQLQSVKRQYSKTSRLAKASLNFLPIEYGPESALHESKIVHCTQRRPNPLGIGMLDLGMNDQVHHKLVWPGHPDLKAAQIGSVRLRQYFFSRQ